MQYGIFKNMRFYRENNKNSIHLYQASTYLIYSNISYAYDSYIVAQYPFYGHI